MIKNDTFLEEIKRYYNMNIGAQITEKLTEIIMALVNRTAAWKKFRWYKNLEDMKSDAILLCIEILMKRKFDLNKSDNPVIFFTNVITNEFNASLMRHNRLYHEVIFTVENSDKDYDIRDPTLEPYRKYARNYDTARKIKDGKRKNKNR